MPIYEYRCNKCEHVFEELVSADNTDPVPCEKCGATDTSRIMSTAVTHMPNPMRGAVNPAHRGISKPASCPSKGGMS